MKAAILLASLTACTIPDYTFDPGENGEPNPPGNGHGEPTPPAPQPIADGTYDLRSTYDVTAEAVLPEPAFEMVGTLRSFSTAPANTLLDVAEDAGVPAVGRIRDALPATLENKLEGWIDEQIANVTIDGVPVTQIAAEIAALAETVLTQFAIDSTLVIDGQAVTHRLDRIDFTGVDVSIELGATQTTTCAIENSSLLIAEHQYALPYGQYAWTALENQVIATYGKAPRALLGDAINCPAIAHAVASKCVLSVCVGHEADLTQICERGLDEVIAVAQRKVEGLMFQALRHETGFATFTDDNHDGRFDHLTGTWTAQINASQGLRPVPATFTGIRAE